MSFRHCSICSVTALPPGRRIQPPSRPAIFVASLMPTGFPSRNIAGVEAKELAVKGQRLIVFVARRNYVRVLIEDDIEERTLMTPRPPMDVIGTVRGIVAADDDDVAPHVNIVGHVEIAGHLLDRNRVDAGQTGGR